MYRKLLPWYIDPSDYHIDIKRVQQKYLNKMDMTLLNWNVHKNNHSYKWLHDFRHILHEYKPDFIAFQEYQTISKKSVLQHHNEYGYGFFSNIEIKSKNYGLLNASRCDISNLKQAFSEDVEPLIKTPKITLLTQYKISESKSLTLVNTHMINFVYSKKYLAQLKQLEFLCQDHQNIILTGDFNTWNKKRMSSLVSLIKSLGLNQVDFELDSHKKKYLPYPLDHIFYKNLSPQSTKILQSVKTSDHKPIILNFTQNL